MILNKRKYVFALLISASCFPLLKSYAQPSDEHNLKFDQIPTTWYSGLPLGNGMCGVLVWQKEGKLRLSVDRADLWDLRPTAEIQKYSYQWAYQHRLTGDWDTVWKVADEPYDRDAAPTKIPGAAIEFDIRQMGPVESAMLDISSAICTIKWKNGIVFRIFVDATQPLIRYSWQGATPVPSLIPPAYATVPVTSTGNVVVDGQDLRRLGYTAGTVSKQKNLIIYDQQGWGPLKYQVAVASSYAQSSVQGLISITSHYSDQPKAEKASQLVKKAVRFTFDEGSAAHKLWWQQYWSKASISIPEKQLEKQWYLETYKLGAASRKGAPPISLQAIWTADNDKLPPWKGDFHSDLNTQLSYWPAYSGNHLEEGLVFTDWLWDLKPYFETYAQQVFGVSGLNVPGVATLRGHPMGGWNMYAMSPTVACWLAQHFYLQWRYSMDKEFLAQRAYPWVADAAKFIEQVTAYANGSRTLPMSSSPEINDGGMDAWFLEMTNYDRALCKYVFKIAADMAADIGNIEDQTHWIALEKEIPLFDIDPETGFTIKPGLLFRQSHRHFSHLMAIHPLGLLKYDDENERKIMEISIANLEKYGTSQWTGYSFSWLGNIYARLHQGEKAADVLGKFASCFCSTNSFHLNGDVCQIGLSNFTYHPFTLEGNFAFASGIQEMLLQSYAGYIDVFPAVPASWTNASFTSLRAEGAILVSAQKTGGQVDNITLLSEQGGEVRIRLPFPTHYIKALDKAKIEGIENGILKISFEKRGRVEIHNGYE